MPIDPQLKEIQNTNKKLDDIINTLNKGTLEEMKNISNIIKDNDYLAEKGLKEITKERSKFSAMVEGAKNRAGTTIWKEVQKNIIRLFDKVIGHVKDVLGPIYDLFSYAWETVTSLFKSIKSVTFDLFFTKTPKHAKETNKHLKNIDNKLKKPQGKGTAGKIAEKDMGLTAIIGLLITGAIIFLGGVIKKIILPFQAIWLFLTKIPFIGKLISGAGGKIFGPVAKWIGEIITWFEKIPFIGKFIGKFFKFLKIGMRVLGWPLQIIMSVIDFIRGFMDTKGDMLDKIIGGLKNVVLEFFDLPIDAIGWIIDKILGFFGVEGADTANKIKGWISFFFDNLAEWLRVAWEAWGNYIKWIGDKLSPLWNGIKIVINGIVGILKVVYDVISESLSPIINTVAELFSTIADYFKNKIIKKVRGLLETLGIIDKETPAPTSAPTTPAEEVQKKKNQIAEEKRKKDSEAANALQKAMDIAKEAAEASAKANTNTAIAINSSRSNSGGGGDSKQTPDELDSALGIHNLAMEFSF